MPPSRVAPRELVASVWRNRNLITTLARRDVDVRYRGSVLGLLWALVQPMAMLAVYTFAFGVVFQAKWGAGVDATADFALVLFAGIMLFNFFAECVNRAPGLILANVNYVKKVVFPLEILPVVALLSALFQLLVSLAVWLLMHLLVAGPPKLSVLYFPLILLPLALLTLGLSWFLASIGVFLRDVGQLTLMATTGLMFLSPIFYPLASLPPRYQQIIALNPMTPVVEQARMVLLWGQAPDYWTIAGQTAGAAALAWLGFAWFQKTRKGFADVL